MKLYNDLNDSFVISQEMGMIILFASILLFVFMIYVGICIIIIKNDLKKIINSDYKKKNQKKDDKSLDEDEKEDED